MMLSLLYFRREDEYRRTSEWGELTIAWCHFMGVFPLYGRELLYHNTCLSLKETILMHHCISREAAHLSESYIEANYEN